MCRLRGGGSGGEVLGFMIERKQLLVCTLKRGGLLVCVIKKGAVASV